MYLKFIFLSLYTTLLFADGGYDNGKAAGKNNWDFSIFTLLAFTHNSISFGLTGLAT